MNQPSTPITYSDLLLLKQKICALEKMTENQFDSRDKAMSIAVNSMDKRLEAMNEFRSSLSDQASKFLTAQSYDLAHSGLVRDVTDIRLTMANRAQMDAVLDVINKRLSVLESAQSNMSGKLWPVWIIIGAVITTLIGWILLKVHS